jgi:uncharacterized protein (UPF0276 family)
MKEMAMVTAMPPINGFGLGLRTDHYADFRNGHPPVDWLEIISENYMVPGGLPLQHLDAIRRDYPMVMHGVSLSIGSVDPLDMNYLADLKALIQRVQPGWVSDHICWTGVDHTNLHDLLPMPHTREALKHMVERIHRVQDFLGQRIALENASTYVAFADDDMNEMEFVSELLQRADCWLLLDVNNVYVSATNHGFDGRRFIDALPAERIRQIHLAGHENHGDHLIDTHDQPICPDVFALYEYTIERFGRSCGQIPTMIERDDNIPPLSELLAELDDVRAAAARALARRKEAA